MMSTEFRRPCRSSICNCADQRRLLRVQKQMAAVKLLIIDGLGFVPLSKAGAAAF